MNKYLCLTLGEAIAEQRINNFIPTKPCLFWTELVILMYIKLLNYLHKYHYVESRGKIFPKIFSARYIEYIFFSFSIQDSDEHNFSWGYPVLIEE